MHSQGKWTGDFESSTRVPLEPTQAFLVTGPKPQLHFPWLHEGTRVGGSDRRRGVLVGGPLGTFRRGIRVALIRYCTPRAANRCKRCGRCARIFCTWFQNKRPRTELMRTESRRGNWDSAVSTIRLFGSEPGSYGPSTCVFGL